MNTFKQISIVAIILFLSSYLYSQKTSTVIISGTSSIVQGVHILVVYPDYSKTYNKEHLSLYVELKLELDKWIKKGYEIKTSSSSITPEDEEIRHTYTLVKRED